MISRTSESTTPVQTIKSIGKGHYKAGPPGSNLFVFHAPATWTTADLLSHFDNFGRVVSGQIELDEKGVSRGYAFVSYSAPHEAAAAVAAMNGYRVHNKRLKVVFKTNDTKKRSKSKKNADKDSTSSTTSPSVDEGARDSLPKKSSNASVSSNIGISSSSNMSANISSTGEVFSNGKCKSFSSVPGTAPSDHQLQQQFNMNGNCMSFNNTSSNNNSTMMQSHQQFDSSSCMTSHAGGMCSSSPRYPAPMMEDPRNPYMQFPVAHHHHHHHQQQLNNPSKQMQQQMQQQARYMTSPSNVVVDASNSMFLNMNGYEQMNNLQNRMFEIQQTHLGMNGNVSSHLLQQQFQQQQAQQHQSQFLLNSNNGVNPNCNEPMTVFDNTNLPTMTTLSPLRQTPNFGMDNTSSNNHISNNSNVQNDFPPHFFQSQFHQKQQQKVVQPMVHQQQQKMLINNNNMINQNNMNGMADPRMGFVQQQNPVKNDMSAFVRQMLMNNNTNTTNNVVNHNMNSLQQPQQMMFVPQSNLIHSSNCLSSDTNVPSFISQQQQQQQLDVSPSSYMQHQQQHFPPNYIFNQGGVTVNGSSGI